MHISKALLKNEIDELDEDYLELVYNILRQFPHRPAALANQKPFAKTRVSEVAGCLHYTGKPKTQEDMDAAIARGIRERGG
jgi:hypothetical protein